MLSGRRLSVDGSSTAPCEPLLSSVTSAALVGPKRLRISLADLALPAGLAEEHERERLAQRARLVDLLVGGVQARALLDRPPAHDVGRGGLDRAAAEHRHDARLDLGRQPVRLGVAARAVEVALDRARG